MDDLIINTDNIELGMVCAVSATNRQAVVDYINGFVRDVAGLDSYLRIELECGNSVDYMTEADVPYESVPCPCGNPKHWLIKYEEV